MRYCQLDKITELVPGSRLVATRTLRADEDYLLDHFPRFPVMPGVMMLEALHQAAVWMIRTGDRFESPLIVLHEAKSVKFGDFLTPGETLQITAELLKTDGPLITVKAIAAKGDRTTVSARLVMKKQLTGDDARLGTDAYTRKKIKEQFTELFGDKFSLDEPSTTA